LLKLKANDPTNNGASEVISKGKVIFPNRLTAPAPSIEAAS
jgi:hypothetical protein